MIYLNNEILEKIMKSVLEDISVSHESIYHMVSSVIQTSLRGVDSHGINLFPHYYQVINTGRVNKTPDIKFTRTAEGTATVYADHAFGHHAGAFAIEEAIKIASDTGICAVNVKDSTHFGAAAYYGLMAADKDCIGLAFTNADALVKVPNSPLAFFGTNPICFTAPLEKEGPLCLDMATSLVSKNKIKNYERLQQSIPENWGFTKEGSPTTEPGLVETMNPIGDYKGFGLGMMVEVLCGLLAGGPFGRDILAMYTNLEEKRFISQFYCVINISKFIEINTFKSNLQNMADSIRSLPKMAGKDQIIIPGDPEKAVFKERITTGIPIDDTKFSEFLNISSKFKQAIL